MAARDLPSVTTERWVFETAMTDMHLHNHLNGAYHEAGLHQFAPPSDQMWWIPVFLVPAKVRARVRADAQVELLRARLVKAREILEELRPRLDQETTSLVNCDTVPYRSLHPALVGGENPRKPGYMRSWSYTFNAYLLGIALLDEYEAFIDETMKHRLTPFTKLSRIWRKAHEQRDSVRFVTDCIGWH